MPRVPCLVVLVAAAIGATALPARGQGISQRQCLDSFEQAQRDRKAGELRRSRSRFRICADARCPALVRKDCTDALAELTTAIPSLKLKVRDADGAEVDDFTLEVDGELVEPSDAALELDPGEHVIVVTLRDGVTAEARVTLKQGELNVPVAVTIGEKPKTSPGPVGTERPSAERPTPPLVYMLGGVAVVGLAGFVGFGLAGRSTQSCEGNCSDDEIDRLHRQYLLADIGLAVFAAAGGAAAYLYLSRPKTENRDDVRPFLRAGTAVGGVQLGAGLRY